MIKPASIVLLLFLIPLLALVNGPDQDIDYYFRKAHDAEAVRNDEKALEYYLEILRLAPEKQEALCKASELYCLLGRRQPTDEKRRKYYQTGLELARKALELYPDHAESNFVMSFAMGRIALIATGEQKINAVRDIKKFAERTVKLDPSNFKGYHVLARWHYEVSSLSSLERWLVRIAYGALPAASFTVSIANYEKSRKLKPDFLLNYLEEAKAYYANEQKNFAIRLLQMIADIPDKTSDDPTIRAEAKSLLASWTRD